MVCFRRTAACERVIRRRTRRFQHLKIKIKKDTYSPKQRIRAYSISALWAVPGEGRAWVDLQNDVTVKDIKQSAAVESYSSVEHMKRYTTQGHGTGSGEKFQCASAGGAGRCHWPRHPRNGRYHIPPTLCAGLDSRHGGGGAGYGLCPAPADYVT